MWDITGNMTTEHDQIMGGVKRHLYVNINGELVISGAVSSMATGELSGRYKDHKVDSVCTSEVKTQTWMVVSCFILIDNERAATLTF